MKNILSGIGSLSKYIFLIGFAVSILIVAASAVLHFGAGRVWDYYFCISLSEKFLAFSRPIGVSACAASLFNEYRVKHSGGI